MTTTKNYEFHPLAARYPMMQGSEYDVLRDDVKKYKLRNPIVLFEGRILDGRNRYRACIETGVPLKTIKFEDHPDKFGKDPGTFVDSMNLYRRHLTAEQRRAVIAELVKAQPEKSDRQIAESLKVSPTTVGAVRTDLEAAGAVSSLDTRTDTRGRKQPAKKPKPAKKATQKKEAERASAGANAGDGGDPETTATGPKKRKLTQKQLERKQKQTERVIDHTLTLFESLVRGCVTKLDADDSRRLLDMIEMEVNTIRAEIDEAETALETAGVDESEAAAA